MAGSPVKNPPQGGRVVPAVPVPPSLPLNWAAALWSQLPSPAPRLWAHVPC